MSKIILFLALTLFFSSRPSYAAHITSDASLTLGKPVTTHSVGNRADNPIIWSKGTCSSQPLWQLVPDPWGVNSSASGSITMEYTGTGSIITTVGLSGLTSAGVNGYPFVFYGHDSYGYHMDGQPLLFPAQLSSMSSLIVDVNYALSVSGKAPGNLNIAFDEWLIPSANYTDGPSGALEILVAPYFTFGWGADGYFVGTITVPVTVDGKLIPMVFNEYSTGTGAGHEIIFFPRDGQIPSGTVRFDLLAFMNVGAATAGLNSTWYLAGIEFGSEFGNASSAMYTLTTNKLSLEQEFTSPR